MMSWGRARGLPNIIGTDPGAGTDHPIPSGARRFSMYAIGTAGDRVLFRTASDATLTGIAGNSFIGPVGVILGPFDIDPQSDTHIQVSEQGAGVTAYYISFTRS
jgi:hypothetical protein